MSEIILRECGENTPKETRRESHESVDKERRYQQIVNILTEYGPLTAKEVAVKMASKGYIPDAERNFSAPRLTELSEKGVVEPIGKKKCKYTGKTVSVYSLM